jgi:hypothetical protein
MDADALSGHENRPESRDAGSAGFADPASTRNGLLRPVDVSRAPTLFGPCPSPAASIDRLPGRPNSCPHRGDLSWEP